MDDGTQEIDGEIVDAETGEVLPVRRPEVARGSELERRQKVSGMLRPVAKPEDVLAAQAETRDLVAKALSEGRDFGTIPGTHKPSLLKPGAERINAAFGVAPRYHVVEREVDHDREIHWSKRTRHGEQEGTSHGLYRYVMECELVHRESGVPVGQGIGSCSTLESKYVDRPRDLENTVLKMAQKRAFIAATLNAYGLSDQFTQDVEDNPSAFGGSSGPFSLDDTLTFGKHKGQTWAELLESEPGYVEWCVENLDRLSDEAREALTKALGGDDVDVDALVEEVTDLLDTAASLNLVSVERAANIEKAAENRNADVLRIAHDWLQRQVEKASEEEDAEAEREPVAAGALEGQSDIPF